MLRSNERRYKYYLNKKGDELLLFSFSPPPRASLRELALNGAPNCFRIIAINPDFLNARASPNNEEHSTDHSLYLHSSLNPSLESRNDESWDSLGKPRKFGCELHHLHRRIDYGSVLGAKSFTSKMIFSRHIKPSFRMDF